MISDTIFDRFLNDPNLDGDFRERIIRLRDETKVIQTILRHGPLLRAPTEGVLPERAANRRQARETCRDIGDDRQ
jgi:hypothetical protein